MILASVRIAKDTDKSLFNREFADYGDAQAWCNAMIGCHSDDDGLVEFILLTDYSTMNTQEYGIENGGK